MSEKIPDSVDEWTYKTIYDLVSTGYFETDLFDFKELLISKGDPNHNLRMTKTAVAFANSRGGFIIFGIKDWNVKLTAESRIVGIENSSELAQQFGSIINKSEPAISYIPGNPPISISGSQKVIFIVKIPASLKGLHGLSENNQVLFYKRTICLYR